MSSQLPRIEIKKLIRVPKDRVFGAWTTPEVMARWMAPGTAEVLKSEVDFKVGGKYRIAMKGEMLGRAYDVVIGGIYREIVPEERLSFTWVYEDAEHRDSVGDSIVTVILESAPEGTRLTLIHEKIATEERREGHLWGWTDCLEKLTATLTN